VAGRSLTPRERAVQILGVCDALAVAVGPVLRGKGKWAAPAEIACRRAMADLDRLAGRRLRRGGRIARRVLARGRRDALRLLGDDLTIVEECLTRAADDVGGREEYPRLVGAGGVVDGMRVVCRLLAADAGARRVDRGARAQRLGAAA